MRSWRSFLFLLVNMEANILNLYPWYEATIGHTRKFKMLCKLPFQYFKMEGRFFVMPLMFSCFDKAIYLKEHNSWILASIRHNSCLIEGRAKHIRTFFLWLWIVGYHVSPPFYRVYCRITHCFSSFTFFSKGTGEWKPLWNVSSYMNSFSTKFPWLTGLFGYNFPLVVHVFQATHAYYVKE